MTYLSGHLSVGFMQPGPDRHLSNWANRAAALKHLLEDAVERSVSIAIHPLKFLNNDLEFSFIP